MYFKKIKYYYLINIMVWLMKDVPDSLIADTTVNASVQ